MSKKIDFDVLKNEIENRKASKRQISENAGVKGNSNSPILPKDEFLNGLLTSLNSGESSTATNIIKMVENKTSERLGENTIPLEVHDSPVKRKKVSSSNNFNAPPQTYAPSTSSTNGFGDRDDALYKEIERKNREFLTNVNNYGGGNQGSTQNYNLNENTGISKTPSFLNEDHVKKIIYENFSSIIENAMRDTIVDLYSSEKIKEVILENKDIIRSVVLNTIRELQQKKKSS